MFNGDALGHFFRKGESLALRALHMSKEDAESVKQYQDDPDYMFAIGCTLLKYFPSLVINTPGYSDVGAFEAE